MIVPNGNPTRNSDYPHAQSIGRQRQAAQRVAADVSAEDLADILPHAAPVTTAADGAPADMPPLNKMVLSKKMALMSAISTVG